MKQTLENAKKCFFGKYLTNKLTNGALTKQGLQ